MNARVVLRSLQTGEVRADMAEGHQDYETNPIFDGPTRSHFGGSLT